LLISRAVLRITGNESEAGGVLRVEGRLVGPWVEELRLACDRHRSRALDLRGLQAADDDGLLLLRRLAGEGTTLLHLSGYLAALLAARP
jgi:hypothetical protein